MRINNINIFIKTIIKHIKIFIFAHLIYFLTDTENIFYLLIMINLSILSY